MSVSSSSSAYPAAEGLRAALDERGVLRLELDRAERRNALDDLMVAGLIGALEKADQDPSVRVALVTGAGEHFCGGFDIVSRNAPGRGERPRPGSIQRRLPVGAHRLIPLVMSVQFPVVCEVRGWAVGIGLHLVLASDFAIVEDGARLWEPFATRGFTPDSGATWLLPRRAGMALAREMLMLGRVLSGTEAHKAGLVHAACPRDELESTAGALVEELASGPTVALGLTKWLLAAGAARPLHEQLADEAYALELSSRTEDFREGLAAMKDRRKPAFKGR